MTQPRFVFWSVIALVASSLGTTQGFAQSGLSIETVEPTRFTVAPNVSTPISMKTLPQAICVLHAEGADDKGPSLTLFADDKGTVRFHIRPSAESDQAVHVEVDCVAGGKTTRFPLHLRPNSSPTPDMPAPAAEVKKSRPGAYVRPALSDEDALKLTTEELVKRGYPPRPEDPEALATWLKAVTHASTFVPARSVANPGIRHGTRQTTSSGANLNNWSGFSLWATQNSRFDWVGGEWNVPTVSPEWNNLNNWTMSSFWVGLDGNCFPVLSPLDCNATGQTNLWQAGTEQDVVAFQWNNPYVTVYATAYRAWTELWPHQPFEQVIPNFAVNPGDDIRVSVWIGYPPAQWPPFLTGPDGIAQIENYSSNEYTTINTSRCARWAPASLGQPACINWVSVPGLTAEWIMERPTITATNGTQSLPDLSDYNWTYMYGASAFRTDDATETYLGRVCPNPHLNLPCSQDVGAVEQIFMFNGSDLLSKADVATDTSIYFSWQGWH